MTPITPNRRHVLGGLLASSVMPTNLWAGLGNPAFLAAARTRARTYVLCGLTAAGDITFRIPLPDRGHAAAAHPYRPEAVGFARRPGLFACVIDCAAAREITRLTAPRGRHFYGHGAYSNDGARLYTTENAYDHGQGVIGVWDAANSYARLGEFASHGIGPHDLRLMPDGTTLVVANGGIETHPDTGRTALNLADMRPNMSYIDQSGTLLDQMSLPSALHKSSIRHLAVSQTGTVGFAMQWQGATASPALLGLHARGQAARLIKAPAALHGDMRGYAGSIAITPNGAQLAITSPRGAMAQVFDATTGDLITTHNAPDICGLSVDASGFVFSTGQGHWGRLATDASHHHQRLAFDNHIIALNP